MPEASVMITVCLVTVTIDLLGMVWVMPESVLVRVGSSVSFVEVALALVLEVEVVEAIELDEVLWLMMTVGIGSSVVADSEALVSVLVSVLVPSPCPRPLAPTSSGQASKLQGSIEQHPLKLFTLQ